MCTLFDGLPAGIRDAKGHARPYGLLYYVMPYVAGETLRAQLARVPQLSVDDAVRILCEVARALDYAHRCGWCTAT